MGIVEILIITAMLLLNGTFAAYELALASISIQRLRVLADEKRRGARTALAMKSRMEASMAVAQVGVTVVAAVAAAIGGANATEHIAPSLQKTFGWSGTTAHVMSIICVVIPLSGITIFVGELLPKIFAIRNHELVCLKLSPPMRIFAAVVYPLVWVLEWLTKRTIAVIEAFLPKRNADSRRIALMELRAQVNLLRAGKVIGEQEEQIIIRASRLSVLTVAEILLPADDIIYLEADAPLSRSVVTAHLDLHTRFPVAEAPGDVQSIIGYVNFKEMVLLAKTHPGNPSLREIVRPMISLAPQLPVSTALRMMMAEHLHLALVRDSAGTIQGMITQEDIFEELVGDIQDEFDRLPRYIVPSGRQFVVGGGTTLARIRAELNRPELASSRSPGTTVNAWLTDHIGDRIKGGDTLSIDGIGILIRKVRRHQVAEALLDPTSTTPPVATAENMQTAMKPSHS
ncbi:MAG TPA: CNNM domain-containing protein [Phycisphaerales bacterium]|nr:CNNM domain-containing protein [Phycisphaerales bacterium]